MKPISVSDIVFLMIAGTWCYLAITQIPVDALFAGLAGTVVGSFYTHKAQNKPSEITTNTPKDGD